MSKKLRKILAIGGGEIGRPKGDGSGYYPVETLEIDNEILRLTNNKSATLLFIPTASDDSRNYFELVRDHFLKVGFSSVNALFLLDQSQTKSQIESAIMSHDAIYVGGGNTSKMMNNWKKRGVDVLLKKAMNKGIVLSGLSAGSICWFNKGTSDLRVNSTGSKDIVYDNGLSFINAINCPHFDAEPSIKIDIKRKLMDTSDVAVCLDNCVALEVLGSEYRIIKSKPGAKAYLAYWKEHKYYFHEIESTEDFKSLKELLSSDGLT